MIIFQAILTNLYKVFRKTVISSFMLTCLTWLLKDCSGFFNRSRAASGVYWKLSSVLQKYSSFILHLFSLIKSLPNPYVYLIVSAYQSGVIFEEIFFTHVMLCQIDIEPQFQNFILKGCCLTWRRNSENVDCYPNIGTQTIFQTFLFVYFSAMW